MVATPSARSQTLSDICGAEVTVKFENLQFTGSYKERGALNRLLSVPEETAGVITASAGNFAQAVAHHAGRLGIPAVIVMPEITPNVKVARTAELGAEVVRHGDTYDDASAHADDLADQRGLIRLSAFDDEDVIAGQGTVALEVLAAHPDLDTLVVPVGGGGLLAGMAVAARTLRPDIELVGVQSEVYPAVHNHLTGDDLPVGGSTIAEGIAVARPGALTTQLIADLVDRVEVVSESLVEQAVGLYLEIEKTVAEGAGAAPLAELLARPERYAGRKVALVLSGGNIDLRQLATVTMRSLVRSGRLSTFWVDLDDRPGQLGQLTTDIGNLGGNIIDVVHRRLDPTVHARTTEVHLTVETSDRAQIEALLGQLRHRGYRIRLPADEASGR